LITWKKKKSVGARQGVEKRKKKRKKEKRLAFSDHSG